jgi:hypothetical protein
LKNGRSHVIIVLNERPSASSDAVRRSALTCVIREIIGDPQVREMPDFDQSIYRRRR